MDLIERGEFLPVDVMILAEFADGHGLVALLVERLLDAGDNGLRLPSTFSGDAHDILGGHKDSTLFHMQQRR